MHFDETYTHDLNIAIYSQLKAEEVQWLWFPYSVWKPFWRITVRRWSYSTPCKPIWGRMWICTAPTRCSLPAKPEPEIDPASDDWLDLTT